MSEPWDIKPEDRRESDTLPTFIIFCEDEVSEPIYFKYFETSAIKVNHVNKQKSKIDNVFKAICYCEANGLLDNKPGSTISKEDIQVWCVFDRDIEEHNEEVHKGNVSFNESIETAKAKGFKIAWSNDAFELWVLMHFEEIDPSKEEFKKRDFYYNKLTEIFKALPNKVEDLKKALKHPSFNYKQDLKHEKNFRNIVRSEIVGKTKIAISRAEILEKLYSDELQYHDRVPCTLVHHLVKELIRVGGKAI